MHDSPASADIQESIAESEHELGDDPPPDQEEWAERRRAPTRGLNEVGRWCLFIGLLLAIPAALWTYFDWQPSYEAKTWLKVDPIYILTPNERMRQGTFFSSQREVIRSAPIISEALAMPEIASLPIFKDVEDRVTWLSGRIIAEQVGSSDLLTISLRGHEKDSLHKVVNAVRNAYLNTLNTNTMRQSDSTLQLLDNERTKRFQEIESLRGRLKALQTNAIDGAEWNHQHPAKVDEKKKQKGPQQAIVVANLGAFQQQLAQLEIDLVIREAELQAMREIDAKKALGKEKVEAINEQLELKQRTAAALRTRIDEAKKIAKEAGANALEMQFLSEDLARKNEVYRKIVDRIEQIRTELTVPAQVLTLQEAQPPIAPIDSHQWGWAAAVFFTVLFTPLPICFAAKAVIAQYDRLAGNEA